MYLQWTIPLEYWLSGYRNPALTQSPAVQYTPETDSEFRTRLGLGPRQKMYSSPHKDCLTYIYLFYAPHHYFVIKSRYINVCVVWFFFSLFWHSALCVKDVCSASCHLETKGCLHSWPTTYIMQTFNETFSWTQRKKLSNALWHYSSGTSFIQGSSILPSHLGSVTLRYNGFTFLLILHFPLFEIFFSLPTNSQKLNLGLIFVNCILIVDVYCFASLWSSSRYILLIDWLFWVLRRIDNIPAM